MGSVASAGVTREELLQRASELVPVLAGRALETEKLRRIPEETVADLKRLGLLRIGNPGRYGGYGLDYDVVLEVGAELGRGDGSAAWCYTVWSSHQWLLGLYPERAQEEYFGSSPDVLASSAFNPARGRVEKADAGWKLSGRWDFSSGSESAQWAVLAGFTEEQGPGLFLVPRSDYRIEDTWFVSGLCGTGSNDIVIEEPILVPEHRFLSYMAMGATQTPGKDLHDRATYRVPTFSVMPFTLAVPLLGIAQGAIDHFEKRTREGVTAMGQARMATLVPLQVALGEATAEVDCARLLMRHDLRELIDRGGRGDQLSLDDRLRFRRDHAYISKLSVQAVDRLFAVSGGRALYLESPLQRAQRDVQAGAKQVALIWNTYAEQYGRVRLGLEPTDTVI
ncbi:MAG: acyl-CoA dehydrogenase family protein [Candidatus Dormibacteraeota bacterium]|nr:acyl-CoA dehydrogenase family protein [Candidatus Dormibacteraeota bacterium]